MAIASPAYRARIFKPRSQQPDPDHPTLLLVPRAGSLHSEPFLVATIPGVADDSPIPDVVDPINGATFNRPVPPAPPGRLVFGQWNVPATAGPFTHLSQATIGGTCTAFSGASVLDFVGGVKGASCTSYTGGLGGGGGYAYQGFFYEGAKRDELQPNHAYVMRLLMWTRPSGLGFEAKGMREYVLPGVLAGGGADSGLGVTPKYFDVHVTSDAGGNVGWALGGFDLEFGSSYVVMLGGMALFDPSLEPEDPNSGGIPSGGDYRPFLALPRGRRGRVDIRSKKTDVGALTLTILDQYVDPTSSTNAERWVTQFWGDEGAKAAMSTCLAVVEESLDGGVTWAPFYTGRVTNARLKGKVELSISVKDLGESLDRDVFVGEPIGVSYARRLPIIPLGLTENWGPLLGTAPLLPGNARLGREGRPYWFRTGLSVSDDADFRGHSKIPAALADLANRTVQPAGTGQQIYLFAPKVARVRITVGSTDTWWWLRQILAELVEEHDAEHWRPRDVLVDPAPELNPTPATFPSSGTDLTWAIYHGPPTVTEASPLLIDDVDPVTFLADLVDGRFSPPDADGNPRPLAPRDPTSWAALAGQLGTWRGFITEKGKARTWAAEHIGQLFQVGLALNAAGQCVLLDLRRGGDPSGFPEIPATEILSAPQAEGAEQNAEEAITRIVAPTPYVRQLDRTEAFAEVEDDHPDVPPGLLAVDEVPDQYLAFGDPRVADFGDQPVTLPMTGLTLIVEGREGLDPAVLVADQTARRTLQQRLADDVFALFAHGPEYFTVVCTRHGVAETTQVGDRRRVTAPALPNAQTNLRGGTRAGLCLERSEDGPKVTLAFVALGLAAEGDPPTFPDPPAQSVEDCATSVTVPVELNAAGDPVMIEWAATAIGDARPADGSAAWRFGARLTASGTALLTGLPSGSRIHLRVRSVPPASSASPFPSPWTATDPAYVETCGLEVLADCAIEIGANGARILTWTGGDPDLPVLIRVDGVLVATVPAGTTRWNTSGYTGTVSIAQHDGAGGTVEGCSVVITGGAGQCPRPAGIQVLVPSAISVAGFPARVSDGTIFGWQLERAPDVSGAPDEGALEVVAGDVEGSPSGAAVVIVDPQPVTGTTWWYRLRHVLAGWTESDPTCWRSGVAQLGTPPQPVPTLPVVTVTAKS
ncbi:MAG TPA: hypothetical protein VEB59_10300, partial [Gemmatimonadales bacterium]|nr:hypothetical protein [Gemmatimonadales bacterium]